MNQERMKEYYECYNRRDHESLSAFYADDAIFEFQDIKLSGKETIANSFAQIQEILSRDILTPKRILIDGERVAVELVNEIEAKEDFEFLGSSLKPGESLIARVAAFYDCRDNKIRHVRIYRF
jgi:ketosteroid isomerase-like protein